MCIINGFIGKEKASKCVRVFLCVCWVEGGVKRKLLMNYNEQKGVSEEQAMDKTVFLGQTINSRLKDSHGQCEMLSSETLTLCRWLVCVIYKSHNNVASVQFPLEFYYF